MIPLIQEEAQGLAELGYKVLPLHGVKDGQCTCGRQNCTSAGKHPRLPNGVSGASDDESVIDTWFWRDANLGIATGGRVLVLDCDDEEGLKFVAALESRFPEVRVAPRATTGRGEHVYLGVRWTQRDRPRTAVKLRPGLDTRYERSYAVAAPSLHASGVRYRWKRPLTAIDELPLISDDLLTLLFGSAPPSQPVVVRPTPPVPARGAVAVPELVPTALARFGRFGSRHQGAVWLGIQACARGVPENTALALAADYAEQVENPRSFPVSEAVSAVRWAYRRVDFWSVWGDQSWKPTSAEESGFGQSWPTDRKRPSLDAKRPLLDVLLSPFRRRR